MKTQIAKIISLTAVVLIASASTFAQEANYIQPKAKSNFYADAGFTYMLGGFDTNYTTAMNGEYSESGNHNFAGAQVAFGWRINAKSKIQVEIGYLGANTDSTYIGSVSGYNNATIKRSINYTAAPVLASYSYCIPFGKNGRWELRLSPTLGLNYQGIEIEKTIPARNISVTSADVGSDNNLGFVYGAGVGVTYHLSKKFYLDLGERYLHTGSANYTVNTTSVNVGAMNAYSTTASVGWKF